MKAIVLLPLSLLVACPGPSSPAADLAAPPADLAAPRADLAAAGSCVGTSTSNLAGVSIHLSGPCRFTLAEAAAGIRVPYEVSIAAKVDGVVPKPNDAGRCDLPGPSGLILFEKLEGGAQHYCVCDQGRCVPPSETPVSLIAGTFPGSFAWDGRNWYGPSDTGNPKGAPFPAGSYTLKVSAVGTVTGLPFEVAATYPITLVP